MSRIPQLKEIDPAERIQVSKQIDSIRLLAEYNHLERLNDRYSGSIDPEVALSVKKIGSTLNGALKAPNQYLDVQGTILQVSGESIESPSQWEKATVTYVKEGNQVGRLVQYEKMDPSGHEEWRAEVYVIASGPQQETIVKHIVVKGETDKLPCFGSDIIAVSQGGAGACYRNSEKAARDINQAINQEAAHQEIGDDVLQFEAIIKGKPYVCCRGLTREPGQRGGGQPGWGFLRTTFELSYRNQLAKALGLKPKLPRLGNDKIAISKGGTGAFFSDSAQAAQDINQAINQEAARQGIGDDVLQFEAIIKGKPYVCYRGLTGEPGQRGGGQPGWGCLRTTFELSYRNQLAKDLGLKTKLPCFGSNIIAVSGGGAGACYRNSEKAAQDINQAINQEAARQEIGDDVLQFEAIIKGKPYVCYRGLTGGREQRGGGQPGWGFLQTTFELTYRDQLAEDLNFEVKPFVDFRNMAPDEVVQFVRDHEIEELIAQFGHRPYFGKLLSVVRLGTFAGTRISDFLPKIADFETGVALSHEGGRPEASDEERTLYIQAILAAYGKGELDLSDRGVQQSKNLLIRMCRQDFEQISGKRTKEKFIRNLCATGENYLNSDALEPELQEYLSNLYIQTAERFERILAREEILKEGQIAKARLYSYQIPGVNDLVETERAILAYGTGLGKTVIGIVAVETLRAEKEEPLPTLWITTTSNLGKVKRNILEFSSLDSETDEDKVQIVISGDTQARAQQFEKIDQALWRIVSFPQLVSLYTNYPDKFHKLLAGVKIVVGDEAHNIGNPESWQSEAVREIKVPIVLFLDATPCKNKLEDYFPLVNYLYPEQFPSLPAFRDMYTRTVDGVTQLQTDSEEFVFYRSVEETLPIFDPSVRVTGPSIPKKVRLIEPDQLITYEMLDESFENIHDMLLNFGDWQRQFHQMLSDEGKPQYNGAVSALSLYTELLQASYLTKRYRISTENPIWKAVDPVVEEAMDRKQKLNLWAFHTELIEGAQERYEKYGLRRMDGFVTGKNREQAIQDFLDDDNVGVLGASSVAGEGLDLYAHLAVYLEPPPTIQRLWQTEGRNLRVIGPDNAKYGKPEVRFRFVVPSYPKRLLNRVTEPRVIKGTEKGSLPMGIITRLQKGEKVQRWLMESGDPGDAELYFKTSVLDSMGLLQR